MRILVAYLLLSAGYLIRPSDSLPSRTPVLRARDSNRGCQAGSFGGAVWTVSALNYSETSTQSAPDSPANIQTACLSFRLQNPALAYEVDCTGHSPDGFTSTDADAAVHLCAATPHSATTHTSFSFNKLSGLMVINQTWICSDVDPQYPTFLKAGNFALISLTCIKTEVTNEHWSAPEQYAHGHIDCPPLDFTLSRDWMRAIA